MRFERLNHAFGYVAAVHVGRNELEGRFPFLLNLLFVGGATLVAEDFEVNVVAVFLETGHDAVGGGKAMAVVLGLEGLDKNDVGVDVLGEHYVTNAAEGAVGEAAHVVGLEIGDGLDADDEFFCGGGGGSGIR